MSDIQINGKGNQASNKASRLVLTVLSALFSSVGCLISYFAGLGGQGLLFALFALVSPFISVICLAASAGFMAAGFCVDKKAYPLLGIVPAAVISAVMFRDILMTALLLAVPLCGLVLFGCASKGGKKTLSVILSTTALLAIGVCVVLLAVWSEYGSVSAPVWEEMGSELTRSWQAASDQYLDSFEKQQLLYLDQLGSTVQIDREQYLDQIEKTMVIYKTALDEAPRMIAALSPALIIMVLNAISYIAASVMFRYIASGDRLYSVAATREGAKLEIETAGMIIYMISYIISMLAGGYTTVFGAVCNNLFLIYLPALTVIGLRILFREKGFKQNMFYVVLIVICLFFNPVIVFPLIGFMAAGNVMNARLIKFLQSKIDEKGGNGGNGGNDKEL